MLKKEEEIRELYRSHIEIWASGNSNSPILYGAILAYGRVLGFNGVKIHKDMNMAQNKYSNATS